MMQEEKDRLIALFADKHQWCQGVDARNRSGEAVRHDDKAAVAWDIVGGMCRLFGWKRASELFGPMSRHFSGRRLSPTRQYLPTHAMTALLDFNDDGDTTYELIVTKLQELPVWRGRRATVDESLLSQPIDL